MNEWPFIGKMCRLEDKSSCPLIQSFLERERAALDLSKRLIQRKADGPFIQPAGNFIQSTAGLLTLSHCSCFKSKAVVRHPAFD